ncbi:hypothetical protein ES319_A12G028300v1 [Gossypium barbadense]|uniref:AB hydrolase-1 domain-containing protein n=1 Tax=Gossypium barbadense TaxID=3634 RepID=A0A5J5T597_GOSBA|nr:hypothetical protein ES319_A12G028300v1 [Gossypium barbadense]
MGLLKIYKFFLHGVLKLAGISPKKIEIQPGTFQALALAKHYSVYVPDFVFFGDSITDKSERSVEFQAECIAKGLKKLGVQKCTLVGFSYGGMVGFKMAEIYPELVHSMVATCSTMALTESISKARLHRLGFNSWPDFLLPDSVQGVETLVQLASHSFPKFPNFIYKEILEGICKYRREKVELLKALVISDEEFTVPSYHQRIHVLWGKNDKIFEVENGQYLRQQIGEKASVEYIENSGHIVQLERPFKYNSCLNKILPSLSSS